MTSNLFRTLLSLHREYVPEEDFFTEIIAWFFSHHPAIMLEWLHSIFGLPREGFGFHVSTQVAFAKLDGHDVGSRVDMVIELYNEEETHVVFLESKIGSDEQPNQLSRYADHLCQSYPEGTKGYLLYVTKYFDPKDEEGILTNTNGRNVVRFEQRRWCEFYQFLKTFQDDPIANEIIEFMEVKGMAEIDRLTPSLLVAFSAFGGVYRFIKQSMGKEVGEGLKLIMCSDSISNDQLRQVESSDRYVVYVFDQIHSWYCMLGYQFPTDFDGFPELFMALEVNGKANGHWHLITEELKKIKDEYKNNGIDLKAYNLDKPGGWGNIRFTVSLDKLLSGPEEHKHVIRSQFQKFLLELENIKLKHPILWELH